MWVVFAFERVREENLYKKNTYSKDQKVDVRTLPYLFFCISFFIYLFHTLESDQSVTMYMYCLVLPCKTFFSNSSGVQEFFSYHGQTADIQNLQVYPCLLLLKQCLNLFNYMYFTLKVM